MRGSCGPGEGCEVVNLRHKQQEKNNVIIHLELVFIIVDQYIAGLLFEPYMPVVINSHTISHGGPENPSRPSAAHAPGSICEALDVLPTQDSHDRNDSPISDVSS